MKHDNLPLVLALVVLLILAAAARAEEPQVTVHGFVDVDYAWNGNHPESHLNFLPGTGSTAERANEISLNLAAVDVTRDATLQSPVGFHLAVVAGTGADVVHAAESEGFRHVYQASLVWKVTERLMVEGGIFPSHIGFEGFYSKDNWNYTRGLMGEASPYYQAGVKATYGFDDRWSGRVDVMNGWQTIGDVNDGKSIGTQLAYNGQRFSGSINTFYGPELPRDDTSMRRFVDLVGTWKPNGALQLGATADFGSQQFPNAADANWYGLGALGRLAVGDRRAVAARVEHFSDPDDAITGAAQKVDEATVTFEVRPVSNLIIKAEARHDRSTAAVFAGRGGPRRTQTVVIVGAVATF